MVRCKALFALTSARNEYTDYGEKRITGQRQAELTFWYFYYAMNRLQLLFHPLTCIEFPVCVVRGKNGEFGISSELEKLYLPLNNVSL